MPKQSAKTGTLNRQDFAIGSLLSFGWEKTKANVTTLILLFIGVMVVNWLGGAFGEYLLDSAGFLGVLFQIAWMIVSLIISMGVLRASLQINRDQEVSVESFRFDGKQIVNFLIASLLMTLIVMVGFIALIIPGIYFALRYQFVSFLVVDKNLTASEALSRSSELTDGIKLKLLWFNIVLMLFNLAGLLMLGVGLLLTAPISYLAQARLYEVVAGKAK